jgi:hypothetical protein
MKKIFLLTAALFVAGFTFAGNAELFKVDEQALNNEFAGLSALENFVVDNNFISLNEIETGSMYDLTGLNVNTMGATSSGEFAFQWEGFLWGFLCCPIGFFVVAVNKNKDHDQKLSYWIGVAAASLFNIIYYIAVAPTYY